MKRRGTVSSKGQLIIPSELRKKLGIRTGTEVEFSIHQEGILLKPVTESAIDEAYGILAGKGLPDRVDRDPERDIS